MSKLLLNDDDAMKIAVYPGTFDPFTKGHLDISERAASLCDQLIVAVSESGRTTWLSPDERMALTRQSLAHLSNVKVVGLSGLLVDFCAKHSASIVVRGVRSFADFEYEAEMASLNRQMMPTLETIFLSTADALRSISGSRVREIAKLGGRYEAFVSAEVSKAIIAKLAVTAPKG